MILSSRDIHQRCQVVTGRVWSRIQQPMIWPYVPEKRVHSCGFSYGLSGASYDLRIAEDVVLPPNPVYMLADRLRQKPFFGGGPTQVNNYHLNDWLTTLKACPELCQSQLAYTLEFISIPDDVCGFVVDKSSHARRFVSAMNTLFDPGFRGHGVLELVNLSREPITILAGEPICQMVFHKVTPGAVSYRGKYFNQSAAVHGTRFENQDGSWR